MKASLFEMHGLDSSFAIRSGVRTESAFSLYGKYVAGTSHEFSILHEASMESSFAVRRVSRFATGPKCSGFDCVRLDSAPSVRIGFRIESSHSVIGKTVRFDSLFSLSLNDLCALDSALSVRGHSNNDASLSIIREFKSDSSVSMRSFGRLDSSLSIFGNCVNGGRVSLLKFGGVESSLSMRNFSSIGRNLSMVSFVKMESQISLRGSSNAHSKTLAVMDTFKVESSISIRFMCKQGSACSVRFRVELTDMFSLIDNCRVGSIMSCRREIKVTQSLSLFASMEVGSNMSVRQQPQWGHPVNCSVMASFTCESSLSTRKMIRIVSVFDRIALGSVSSSRCVVRAYEGVSSFGLMNLGSTLSIRETMRISSKISVMDRLSLDSSVSIRMFVRCGSLVSLARGFDCNGSFSLFGTDSIGSRFSVRSYIRFDNRLSVHDSMIHDSMLSCRSMSRSESAFSVRGLVASANVSRLSIILVQNVASSFSVRLVTKINLCSVYDCHILGSSLSIRGSRIESGSVSSALDYVNLDSSVSLRCDVRLNSRTSVVNFLNVDSSLSVRQGRVGINKRVSVLMCYTVGSMMSIRSITRIGSGFSISQDIRSESILCY